MTCRKCGANIEFSPFRAESLKRFREFMALAGVLALIASVLHLLRVELWPWWVGGSGLFVLSQALLKWHDSRWVICKHCHEAYTLYRRKP